MVVLLVVATLLSLAVALTILVRLPSDYFCAPRASNDQETAHGSFFPVGIVFRNLLRNLLGAVLIGLGIILSLPGVPGQGLLTVLAGLLLLDFPGKRSLLHKLVNRPRVLQSINRLRAKFSQPSLVVGRVAGEQEP